MIIAVRTETWGDRIYANDVEEFIDECRERVAEEMPEYPDRELVVVWGRLVNEGRAELSGIDFEVLH